MSKIALHEPFGHLQFKLWAKERSGVKLAVWLPTTKSRESTSSWRPLTECNMALESSRGELQIWFRPRSNRVLQAGDMSSQSPRTPTQDSFRTSPWESREKNHLDVASAESCKIYYMREGGGFPRVQAVVSQVYQSAHGLSQHPKVFPNVN
jgi:hypothetical protein